MSLGTGSYSAKVFPSTGAMLDADEEAQIAKLGALVAPAMQSRTSFRSASRKARSIDFSSKSALGTQRSRKNLSSFLSSKEEGEDDNEVNLEMVINFLTSNIENVIADRVYLKDFEDLCHELMKGSRDPELHRILKSHGWTGTRFKNSTISPLDMHSLLQDFSNLYLRYKVSVYTTHITTLYEAGNAKATDQIFSFVPDSLLAFLEQQEVSLTSPTPKNTTPRDFSVEPPPASSSAQNDVRCATFTGACMLADISGFSKFSGAMCSKGVSGLDDLREATNGFLGHIVKIVYEFQGDVIAFAGDALICVFLDEETGGESVSMKNSVNINCCYRALQCANVLKNHKTAFLSAHIGVSYGEMKMALLGGLNEQWVYLMNGECVTQLAACIESAGSQEVAATKECYEKAKLFTPPEGKEEEEEGGTSSSPQYQSLTAGMKKNNKKIDLAVLDEPSHKENERIRAHDVEEPTIVLIDHIDPKIYHKEAPNHFRRMESHFNNTNVTSARIVQFQADEERDRQKVIENAALFVPRPILSAIHSEALDHIGELRHVTTMFVSLDSYSPDLNSDPCTLQPFFLMAQKVLQESGGFLRQFLVDDKGCVFIAMWGMPSFTYSNNASRALYCGVAVSKGVGALGHKVSIGISTGNVFCGTVGAPERRDYAGIGTDVNMAARLMGKAHGRVLLDVKTYHNLNEKTRRLLIPAEEMKLKGNDMPVTPYQYDAETIPPMEGVEDHHDHAILRRPVKSILGIQIDKIANTEASHKKLSYFTLVIGPPGTGKSTAVEYFRHSARKRNVPCIFIKARPGHEGVPYGLMQELFLELVGDHNFRTEEQQKAGIKSLVDAAYANRTAEEKRKAMFSLEIVLGVEWGKSNRKVGSFSDVVTDAVNSNKAKNKYGLEGGGAGAEGDEATKEDAADTFNNNKSGGYDGMLFDSSMTHLRAPGDLAFYNVLHLLLKNRRVAIIIEDAHFCDELSWTELNIILNGRELEVSILLTMRSNAMKAASAAAVASSTTNGALSFNSPTAPGSFSQHSTGGGDLTPTQSGMTMLGYGSGSGSIVVNGQMSSVAGGQRIVHQAHRNSVLVNAISNSISISRSISVDAASPKSAPAIVLPSGNPPVTDAARLGLKAQSSPALLSILGHERATVIEMTGLGEFEVREVLLHTLKVDHVSQKLVKLVFDVSSGNAYWCKAIANFIKERGVKELEDAIQKGDSPHNALKVLILMRMEKLEVDHQLVLKNAAIIGDEFSESMLHHVLPVRIQATLAESLDLLAEHGFIFCVEEHPESIFAFQNDLIRETVYELLPPRDSAHVHLMVAQFIEEKYAGNLRPFYPMLGLHYNKSIGNRNQAFKYQLKAADQALSRGAFSDGLIFLETACKLAVSKPELKVTSDVITRALRDIVPPPIMKTAASIRRPNNKAFAVIGVNNEQLNLKIEAYKALQARIQVRLEKILNNNKSNVLGGKAPGDVRLTWQPSYVASRMNEFSDSDEDTPTPSLKSKVSMREKGKKKKASGGRGGGLCSIS